MKDFVLAIVGAIVGGAVLGILVFSCRRLWHWFCKEVAERINKDMRIEIGEIESDIRRLKSKVDYQRSKQAEFEDRLIKLEKENKGRRSSH